MGYRLGDKDINLTRKRMSKIGTGVTGDVYRYRNMALKIFKNSETPMSKETASYLTTISTNRILLPRKLLFYNSAFKGYSYTLVPKKGHHKNMISLPKDEFIENIALLERDVEKLSHRSVLLNGIEPSNCIFNGRLYITDPSKYSLLESIRADELETLNKYQLYLLLSSIITSDVRKENIDSYYEKRIKDELGFKDSLEDSSDFFDEMIGRKDNLKEYVKSL